MTFDVKTLEALRGEPGSDEGKIFNRVGRLQASATVPMIDVRAYARRLAAAPDQQIPPAS